MTIYEYIKNLNQTDLAVFLTQLGVIKIDNNFHKSFIIKGEEELVANDYEYILEFLNQEIQ